MSSSVDGLVSGLDTSSLISQLMAAERAPQDRLVATRAKTNNVVAAYQSLNTKLATLRDAAANLATASGWGATKASSSAPTVATATTSVGALGGSLTFTVDHLATSASIISNSSAASLSSQVTTSKLLVSAGGAALGVSTFAGAGLTTGAHTIKVTQASTAASKTASGALGASTAITLGSNDTIDVEIDGVAKTYTIAPNASYTKAQLATAIQNASGGDLQVTVDGTDHLVFSTVDEGSQATLKITGGTALTDVGLTGAEVGGSASAGTDATIDVDGTVNTVSDVRAGATALLTSGTGGTVSATLAGGLRLGTVNAKNVDTGDGSLSAVINAVNAANVGVTASAIQVAAGQLRLQLSSSATGLAGAVSTDTSSISLGGFTSLGTASDASITIGSGAGAFSVSSSSNHVTNVLTGVSLDLVSLGTATVTVNPDVDALAAKVNDLVTQINGVLSEIKTQSSYDADTNTAGLLMGDFTVRTLQTNLISAVSEIVTTSTIGTASGVGISITRAGSFTFDKSKFVAAYNTNPGEVTALFQRGGTATSSDVSLALATNRTRPGTYAVQITQAASRGEAVGAVVPGGTITAAETIDVRVGGATGTTISYAASAGATLQSIADGLNAAAAPANLAILATVESGALVIRTTGYGSSESIEVQTSALGAGQTGIETTAGYHTHTGTNVAGSINGVASTGVGRLLVAPNADATLAGLTLNILSTAADVAGAGGTLNLGTFTYVPGVGQRIASAGNNAVDSVSGTLTAAINGHKSQISDIDDQIERWEVRLATREANLKKQFAAMETALSSMKQQSQWLAGQVNSLDANRLSNS